MGENPRLLVILRKELYTAYWIPHHHVRLDCEVEYCFQASQFPVDCSRSNPLLCFDPRTLALPPRGLELNRARSLESFNLLRGDLVQRSIPKEIEQSNATGLVPHMGGMDARRAVQDRERQARRRATEIEDFWRWAPEWMESTGNTEEELLRRFPSFRGTKPDARR